jgi:hypothetical protein
MRIPFLILFLSITNVFLGQEIKVVHVFVALCDNKNQGIVPVPEKIGNGQDPRNNLYWGCRFGVRTHFSKLPDWKLVSVHKNIKPDVLERCVFKNTKSNIYMIADGYDGKMIRNATIDFLKSASGDLKSKIIVEKDTIYIGGGANLMCYVGHNGLMDFSLNEYIKGKNKEKRKAIVLACASVQYFLEPINQTGAEPFLLTTNLMSPEAYTLDTAIDSWNKGELPDVLRKRVAETYNRYQKCGFKGAYNLFRTRF